jgi:hypothetical protein
MAAVVPPELIDDLIDSYVDWREECLAVEDAYDLWASSSADHRDLACAAYRAALDREQQASSVYADRCNRVELASKLYRLRPSSLSRAWMSRPDIPQPVR